MDGIPFLELWPEYRQELMYNLILEFAALVILTLLIVQFFRRKHRSFELTLFFQMCLVDAAMALCSMAFDIAPLFWKIYDDEISLIFIYVKDVIPDYLNLIFAVTLLAQWLIYVEYTLHQSRDLIRRRYPAAMIPFITAVILNIGCILMLYWKDLPFDPYTIFAILSTLSHIVLFSYIIGAYVVWFLEKKQNRIPAYIRLTPTTVCIILGFFINLMLADHFIADYEVLPLSFALGLLFADYYMYRRLNTIDPDTGLYNKKYLNVMINTAKKDHLSGATVISFKVQRGSKIMASVLKLWAPKMSKTITMGDGLFLMISDPVKDMVTDRFIHLLRKQAANEGIPVDISFETDPDAPLDQIISRYI